MKSVISKWLLATTCFLLAACAVITVNVYFPEKAAKEAYKSLDDMLLKGGTKPPAGQPAPTAPAQPQAQPQSRLLDNFSLVTPAYADESEADKLAIELSSMPEVLKAYDDMSRRLPRLQQLFASGGVTLNTGTEAAEAKDAVYAVNVGTMVLTGDVLLTQGQNAMSGQKLMIDLTQGTGQMDGRVQTVFQPKSNP